MEPKNTRKSARERLETKFYITPSCWNWTGSLRGGYGLFGLNGKVVGAHRASYQLYIGEIPDGMMVCHKCDNRRCVNPDHFFLGTNADNCADRQQKGRSVIPGNVGQANGCSKLAPNQVMAIRTDSRTSKVIAQEFGISAGYVRDLKRGVRWNHL